MGDYLKNKSVQDGMAVFLLGLALGGHSLYGFTHSPVKAAWIMSPYLFPMLIACFAVGLGACLFAAGKRQTDRGAAEEGRAPVQRAEVKKVICVAGMGIAYLLLLPVLTFIPATALFLYALMSFMGERRRGMKLSLALIVPLVLFALFSLGLNVRLP